MRAPLFDDSPGSNFDPPSDPLARAPGAPIYPLGPGHRSDRFEADPVFRPVARARTVAGIRGGPPSWLRILVGEDLRTLQASSWLIMFSLLDLLMTYVLLRQGVNAYEANPIAQWWFARWNIAGMTAFKFLMVGLIISICEIIERHRPYVGQVVLWLGSAAAGLVILHGLRLYLHHVGPLVLFS